MTYREIKIKRKCGCCGEYFYISKNNIDDAIYYDKKTYHSRCFISICQKRSEMKRTDISQKWQKILSNIISVKDNSYCHLMREIEKEEIFIHIKENYDITIIPTTVWHKLNSIYAGTFKGMTTGIPPSHLLDMWVRKMNLLNSIAHRNTLKGICMSVDQRLNYDLSVLINKYDSYLKWLEKQKIIEAEKAVENTQNIIAQSIGYGKTTKIIDSENDDISALVDDIFGEGDE